MVKVVNFMLFDHNFKKRKDGVKRVRTIAKEEAL